MKKLLYIVFLLALLCTACSMQSSAYYSDKDNIASYANSYCMIAKTQKIEGQTYAGTLDFEGTDTLWSYEAQKDCTVDISYLLSVTAGKAKLVLITPDNKVTTITELTERLTQNKKKDTTLSLQEGFNRIKLVAEENTSLSLEFHCELGELEKLGI